MKGVIALLVLFSVAAADVCGSAAVVSDEDFSALLTAVDGAFNSNDRIATVEQCHG